jgi:hemerythrin
MTTQKLEWQNEYSVGVEEIDNQHKKLFTTINDLIDAIDTRQAKEKLEAIIMDIVNYKMTHFDTEEKYFRKFNYDGAEEHIAKHREFNDNLEKLKTQYPELNIEFAFALVDFLEDWLIEHLITFDQKYVPCFRKNGLK